jgi:hypothetical protein
VPFDGIDQARVVPDDLVRPVTRLVTAYRPESRQGQAMGVVAVPEGGHVGSQFDRSAMGRLGYALLAGVVAGNPPMAVSEEEQEPNAGWAVASAENALLYGHPLSQGDSYVIQTGVLARVTTVRHALGKDLPGIEPPVELPRPMFFSFDEELAEAVHVALGTADGPPPAACGAPSTGSASRSATRREYHSTYGSARPAQHSRSSRRLATRRSAS